MKESVVNNQRETKDALMESEDMVSYFPFLKLLWTAAATE